MSLLAASLFLACGVGGYQTPYLTSGPLVNSQLRQRESFTSPQYDRILPSLATLVFQGRTVGTAVLIDRSGLYLASKDSVGNREVEALFSNQQHGHLKILSEDSWTQLVLLRSDYIPPNSEPVVPAFNTPPGSSLFVVLRGGAIPARVASDARVGVVRPSNRVVPLSEIRLELPESSIGNAPVFTEGGKFVGLISGSLSSGDSHQAVGRSALGQPITKNFSTQEPVAFMGPATLTVGYLPSLEALKLVIDGFRSPDHAVEHPTLGVYCTDGAGGALIREVVPDSPAQQIGLRDGDMITGLGIYLVRNKNEFAKALFKYRVGSQILVRIDRYGKSLVREVTLSRTSE